MSSELLLQGEEWWEAVEKVVCSWDLKLLVAAGPGGAGCPWLLMLSAQEFSLEAICLSIHFPFWLPESIDFPKVHSF